MPSPSARSEPAILLVAVASALVISAVHPHDYLTWWLEVMPVFIVAPLLIATAHGFPLTPLAYRLIAAHALILMVGGHYTYAEVPLGYWLQRAFDLARNHYDRLGRFAQGFVPAIVARETLLRRSPLVAGKWLFFIVCSICLAVSACYEFIEWWTAVLGGGAADAFLGTQGDVWDTQWDMLLARVHDRQLQRLSLLPRDHGSGESKQRVSKS